jgi:hypothetical protein
MLHTHQHHTPILTVIQRVGRGSETLGRSDGILGTPKTAQVYQQGAALAISIDRHRSERSYYKRSIATEIKLKSNYADRRIVGLTFTDKLSPIKFSG